MLKIRRNSGTTPAMVNGFFLQSEKLDDEFRFVSF